MFSKHLHQKKPRSHNSAQGVTLAKSAFAKLSVGVGVSYRLLRTWGFLLDEEIALRHISGSIITCFTSVMSSSGAICSSQPMEMVTISLSPPPTLQGKELDSFLQQPAIWPEKAGDETNVLQASRPQAHSGPEMPDSQLDPATAM